LFFAGGIKVETIRQTTAMYQDKIVTRDQALCHLFFHCCLKDEVYTESEMDLLSRQIVNHHLNKQLDLKEEMIIYRCYFNEIPDDESYIKFLVQKIQPVNRLALYSYCMELRLGDNEMRPEEQQVLQYIGHALNLEEGEQAITKAIFIQRYMVEKEGRY
jgi:uncharacterized tellurite resistance protein B-like protein